MGVFGYLTGVLGWLMRVLGCLIRVLGFLMGVVGYLMPWRRRQAMTKWRWGRRKWHGPGPGPGIMGLHSTFFARQVLVQSVCKARGGSTPRAAAGGVSAGWAWAWVTPPKAGAAANFGAGGYTPTVDRR